MKRFSILSILFILSISALAQTTPVLFPVNSLFGGAAYNRPLTVTAANTLISDGQNLWAGTYTIIPASTTNPVVNLYPNTYLVTVPGVVKPARFVVPASTNILDVTGLIAAGPLFYFGTNGFANLLAGSNITLVTNSGGIVINSSVGAITASQVTGLANGATNATGTNLMDAAKGIAGFQWLQHLTSGSTNPGSVQIAADSAWGGGPWIDMDNTLDQITIHAAVVNFSDVATATVSGQFYGHLFGDADTADLASLATGLAPGSASNRLAAAVQPGTAPSLGLANVTGTLPAATLPGNVVTNVSDAQMAAQELANSGQLGNLVDFASFCTGEMTNSYRGRPVYVTGQTGGQLLTGSGANFTGYGSLMIPVSVAPSNTIVLVWKPGITNLAVNNGQTLVFQLVNTNNGDSEYLNYSVGLPNSGGACQPNFNMSHNSVPSGTLGNANLMEYNNPLGGMDFSWHHMRHVTAISHDGAGNVTIWDNGQIGQWYVNSQPTLAFANYPQSTLNALSVGGYIVTNGITTQGSIVTNGFYGNVESVWLFNGPANTNLVQSTLYASDWVQPFTVKDWWIGDSRCGQSPFFTNSMADACEAWRHDAIYYDFAQGGTRVAQFSILTNWNNLQKPHGKVQRHRILVAAGINDIYNTGNTGAQVWGFLTNDFLPMLVSDPRYELDVFGEFQTWTNAYSTQYPQSASGIAAIQIYNQCLATNRSIVTHYYDRYAFAPQSLLATNTTPRYSLLGLHLDETNGLTAYAQVNLGSFICEQTGMNPFVTTTNDQFYLDWGGRMVGVGTNGSQIYGPAGNVESSIGPAGFSGNAAGLTNYGQFCEFDGTNTATTFETNWTSTPTVRGSVILGNAALGTMSNTIAPVTVEIELGGTPTGSPNGSIPLHQLYTNGVAVPYAYIWNTGSTLRCTWGKVKVTLPAPNVMMQWSNSSGGNMVNAWWKTTVQ